MKRSEFISNRLREVFLNGHWIANTNFKEQIQIVTWKQATFQVGSLNSIALLCYHINYYLGGLINVFENGTLEIRDKYSFDMPPIKNEDDWQNLINSFLSNAEKFAMYVEQMPEPQFDEVFVDEKYGTYLRNLEGIIEHSYYHLGQISMLKKLNLEKE